MRKINKELFNSWLERNGNGVGRLMAEAGVSFATVYKLRHPDWNINWRRATIINICRVTGYSEDELFPYVKDEAS